MEHYFVLIIVIMIVILLVLQQPKRLDTNAYGVHHPDPSLVKAVARERKVWNKLSKAGCANCPSCPCAPRRKRCGPPSHQRTPEVVHSKPVIRVKHVHSVVPERAPVNVRVRNIHPHRDVSNEHDVINHMPMPPPPPMPAVLALPPPSTLIATIPKPVKKKQREVMVCQGKYCPYKLGISSDTHYSNPGGPFTRN
jgi:hypothetical protein